MADIKLRKVNEYLWEIPKEGKMRVPARIYATEAMIEDITKDQAPVQAANVAHLPGIVKYSLAMPDIHWGYGFPIGGVAAFDVKEGVISPGGVGYDVNCLSGGSLVLHQLGYTIPIAQMEQDWAKAELCCQNLQTPQVATTRVARFLKRKPANPVYRITTEAGDEIIATAEHPFWTPNGMTEVKRLTAGDKVAMFPFQGVPYDEPSSDVIVEESRLKRVLLRFEKDSRGHGLEQVLLHLRERGLLPLRYNSPQLPYLTKVLGYVFGDGTIYFTNRRGKGVIWFWGKAEDLEQIRKDITAIGYSPSRIYTRNRQHRITTAYGTYDCNTKEAGFKVVSSSLAALLAALGAPVGRKTTQDYDLPAWIRQAPLWQKRLFLAALFSTELTSPQTFEKHGYNFLVPIISMNKRQGHLASGRTFLEGLAELLSEFGVKAQKISERAEQKNPDGVCSHRLRLVLSGKTESLINLWGKVGFDYNQERRALANVAVQYLKLKAQALNARSKAAELAVALHEAGVPRQEDIDRKLANPALNERFLERSLYYSRTAGPRIHQDFPTFQDYLVDATLGLGLSGMVWERIANIEPIPFYDDVYDFTVEHPDHNFIANGFVVSNCGVRLMRTNLKRQEIQPKRRELIASLFHHVPTGVGSKGEIRLSAEEEKRVLVEGARWAVRHGFGTPEDLQFIEEGGCIEGADPSVVSHKALERGRAQLGTLGSGNHFLEVGFVAEIYDEKAARALGLELDTVTVIIHCGSRGFGHQICEDYLEVMDRAVAQYGIELPDRQLACTPIQSPEGQNYLKAMRGAVNYAFCNRQIIGHWTREAFERALGKSPKEIGLEMVYEVAHNIAKIEKHLVDGKEIEVCVHRKGATRAFPAGREEIPEPYRDLGQPVLIPGDMGRYSYVLIGTEEAMKQTFGSTCHGAGRAMSRHQAIKTACGRSITKELEKRGIIVMGATRRTIDEEISEAYKDVAHVVDACELAGISKKVAQLRPLGAIKG